ncbi:hypothetical protein [Haliangium sp.]|uniref:hypothetical protein n=1 Tax=Haliangium sp. TaxID=2663208 RepID=UPI003D12885C
MPFRIIPGPTILDKLPWWFTMPFGAGVGGLAGYLLSQPGRDAGDALLAVLLAVAIAWCGLSAPRGIMTEADLGAEAEPPPPPPPPRKGHAPSAVSQKRVSKAGGVFS